MFPGLAFTLYAPLASFGDIAVGERRAGFDRPARSALLGLVAAALGIDRGDEDAHTALDHGYRLAQRVRLPGTLVDDYHTVQAPIADRKARWATRREALASARLETLLSLREYRTDVLVDVALIQTTAEGPVPEALAAALTRPVYALYAGRKACPLGMAPQPICAPAVSSLADLFAALDTRADQLVEEGFDPLAALGVDRLRHSSSGTWDAPIYADADLAGGTDRELPDLLRPAYVPVRIERRRDRATSRRRWQFELRDEIVARSAEGSA